MCTDLQAGQQHHTFAVIWFLMVFFSSIKAKYIILAEFVSFNIAIMCIHILNTKYLSNYFYKSPFNGS